MVVDKIVILFMCYCIAGYIAEVIYCSIGQRHLVNRGFLYGPWLPIYGFGGVSIYLLLSPLANYGVIGFISVFLLSAIIASIIEYIGSWGLEKIYSIKLWDYSKHFGNINGRVCLLNSSLFGLGGIGIIYVVNPPLEKLISRIPSYLYRYIAESIVVILAVDFVISSTHLKGLQNMLIRIKDFNTMIEARYDEMIKEGREDFAREYKARLQQELERMHNEAARKSRHLFKVFPTCTTRNKDIKESMSRVRAIVEKKIETIRNERRSNSTTK